MDVFPTFLNREGQNDAIFTLLGIEDKQAFCSEAYGYPAGGGDWPIFKAGDFDALERVLLALHAKGVEITVDGCKFPQINQFNLNKFLSL